MNNKSFHYTYVVAFIYTYIFIDAHYMNFVAPELEKICFQGPDISIIADSSR